MKKLFVIYILVFAMVTDPMSVALAQANNSSALAIQQLNSNVKKISGKQSPTMQNLWQAVQGNVDGQSYEQLQKLFESVGYQKVPEIRIVPIQSKGKETVRLILKDQGGVETTMDILNDGDRLFKIGDQIFRVDDLQNLDGFLKRGYDSQDVVFRKAMDTSARSTRYALNSEEFSKLNMKGKVEYLYNLRGVLVAANQVNLNTKSKDKKGAQNESEGSADSAFAGMYLIDLLLGELANANGACVIGGFPSQYKSTGNDTYCDYDQIVIGRQHLRDYPEPPPPVGSERMGYFARICRGASGQVPCNPLVFGFQSDGSPHCLTRDRSRDAQFQLATQRCDQVSPLGTGQNPNAVADTIRIIKSIAKARGIPEESLFVGENVSNDPAQRRHIYDLIQEIIREHTSAITACRASQSAGGVDRRQAEACTALERRVAALNELMERWRLANPPPPELSSSDPNCPQGQSPTPPAPTPIVTGDNPPAEPPQPRPNQTEQRRTCPIPGVVTNTDRNQQCTGSFYQCNKDWIRPLAVVAAIGIGLGILCLTHVICKKKKKSTPVIETPVTPPTDNPPPPIDPKPPVEQPKSEGQGTNQTSGNSGSIRGTSSNPTTIRQSTGKQ